MVAKIIEDDDRWVDVMMKEELGLQLPEKTPFYIGLSTLTSFIIIGFIPLFAYVISAMGHLEDSSLFPLSVVLTASGFILIGWMKSYVNETSRRRAVAETLVL